LIFPACGWKEIKNIMEDQKKTILVVEDEMSVQNALADKFEREGFEVLRAKDGAEGLKAAIGKRPSIILLDIAMPKMDGIEMMRRLREENEYGKSVPVIILTNLTADDKITWAVAKDEPAYYLIKSDWRIEDVVGKVRETLAKEKR
jgi:CheY-like chemotaxis protein